MGLSRIRAGSARSSVFACALAAAALAGPAASAAPLAEPALSAGQDIRQETGEITVNGSPVTVVRYTWRDSAQEPRSVSLVPASLSTMGYAVQMSHVVNDGVKRTAYITADPGPDGGFGYFVSHELFRDFSNGSNGTISATFHGEDDSPLGRYLPSNGTADSAGVAQAAHEFRVLYPRWGTVASIPNPDGVVVSANPADHQKFMLPVVVRWHFVAGQDYPLWSVDYDLTAAGDHIATDVRGPYGTMQFNEGVGNSVTTLKWGDKYHFSADANPADLGAAASPAGSVAWTWNAANGGRRYNVLGSGSYEFGLVDTVPFANSRYGDGYADHRGTTSAGGGCGYGMQSLPCDYEWAYQSFQYDYGPPARPKIAWGSSPFLGSSTTIVYINGAETEIISGKGRIHYGVHIVFGRTGPGAPRTLARAAVPLEAAPTLAIAASPAQGGSVSYTVLGDAGGPYTTSGRTLAPWDSVSLTATAAAGFTFTGWSGPCAGVAGPTCLVAMDQARTVTASFTASQVQQFTLGVAANGAGTVTSSPAGISCGATCAALFDAGTVVSLTATPAAGSAFSGWSGDCTGAGACQVTMSAARSVTATFAPVQAPARLGNISTRGQVLTGNDVMIGGFVIGGSGTKTVVVRARGPSLAPFGIANPLQNPTLRLVRSSDQATLAINDDWGSAPNAGAIGASGFAPSNGLESAILMPLPPGAYTAIVSGVNNGTGVAIVEVFEVDHPETPLANISTRGRVFTGNDVMIGGFVIQGDTPQTVVVRARGPSLAPFGIANPLANPYLQLFSGQAQIAFNDNWKLAGNAAQVTASGFAPSDDFESAILITLNPGAYTAIVSGVGGTTGVGIVEVFAQ